jgi:hypothetical protein
MINISGVKAEFDNHSHATGTYDLSMNTGYLYEVTSIKICILQPLCIL